jgi:ribosome biogenesis GTPase
MYGSHAELRLPGGRHALALIAPKVHKFQGVCVGDRVFTEGGVDAQERVIQARAPRTTELRRLRGEEDRGGHAVAANVDQMAIVSALREPPLRSGALDRYLVLASILGIPPLIVIAKADQGDEHDPAWAVVEQYRSLAPVVVTAARTLAGIEDLARHLRSRITVFAGHSGVGKSSLCHALGLSAAPATGELSLDGRGRHTTSYARLLELQGGGCVVDTPGVRAIGFVDLERRDARAHFPDFVALARGCEFPDCEHLEEEGCAVREAVGERIGAARYEGYRRLVASLS